MIPRLAPILLALAVVSTAASAGAAGPPLETAQKRQATVRADHAKQAPAFEMRVSVTARGVVEYRGSALDVSDASVELAARAKDETLELGADQPAPWSVIWVLIASSDPIADLQDTLGRIDAASTSIEPMGEAFVYVFGDSPQIALSRDLTHIRRVEFRSGEHTWQLRLDGEVGDSGLPAQIHVIRSGQPYANVELSEPQSE